MGIRIETEETGIPISIAGVDFKLELTDENVDRIMNQGDEVQKELEGIESDDIESQKEAIKKSLDFILGDGAFDKLYEVSPSVIIISNYYWSLTESLVDEISKKSGQTARAKREKFLKKKK